MTPEQEASYENEDWVNSTPKEDVQVQVFRKPPQIKDTLYKGPLDNLGLKTSASIPAIKPSSTDAIMSHMCGDTPDQFAAVIGQLIAPTIQDKSLVPRVPTKDLHAPKTQITDALRPITTSDPYLPSVRMTPNKLAIVPRQRSTAQLPPHMRLHEDIEYSPSVTVETLVNAAIVAFHEQHHRLPHRIIIAAIRYWRYRISSGTYDPDIFYYKDAPIPITHAPVGEFGFGINEVRLD